MTTSVLSTLSATNVRLHARMTSMTRPDKVIVLRSQPSGNRIEVNFRSYFDMNDKLLRLAAERSRFAAELEAAGQL